MMKVVITLLVIKSTITPFQPDFEFLPFQGSRISNPGTNKDRLYSSSMYSANFTTIPSLGIIVLISNTVFIIKFCSTLPSAVFRWMQIAVATLVVVVARWMEVVVTA